jgi:hypothetical protein
MQRDVEEVRKVGDHCAGAPRGLVVQSVAVTICAARPVPRNQKCLPCRETYL